MRIAVLADIHGNADALAAVLTDIRAHAPDVVINLGDVFSGPLDPARTADLLADLPATTIMGNHDRWLLDPATRTKGWEAATAPALSAAALAWLATLPATATLPDIFACHATPQDDLTYWMETITPDGAIRRAPLDQITARAAAVPQSLILCGHTHIARSLRLPDGRMIVNPGSVGCPGFIDDDHSVSAGHPFASYAIIDSTGPAVWSVTQRLIPYDTRRVVALATAAGSPGWATALATGWIDPAGRG